MKKLIAFSLLTCGWLCAEAPKLRLPESVAPVSYKAALTLDPAKDDFAGTIQIKIMVKAPVSTIWLNATQLHVSSAKLRAGGKLLPATLEADTDDFLGLKFDAPLQAGPAELEIAYTGAVRQQDSSGIFRMLDNGNKYLYTQFESTDARDAFPCFDEPSFKVPWQLTLTIPSSDTAVSNTSIMKKTASGGQTTYVFDTTKPLPSYLVAFAVGPFEYVNAGKAGKRQIPVRIVTPKGHADEAGYAAKVTATIITRLEDYFGVPFPYDKSDQLAIPVTFGFGAMENAGLVTYAQDIILAKPSVDTITRQREYAEVAAHELAHQWFGDLVTTAWWNDIWLNEAFATWMEQKLIREWKPEWNTRVDDVESKVYAEGEDRLPSARRIRQDIVTKDDISNAFDGITYQKGAAVIAMFESWVGPAVFRKGVTSYLTHYAYRNGTAGEFLDAISSAGTKNVNQAFSTFLNQPGVPLLSVKLDCGQTAATLHVKQQRFTPMGLQAAEETWQIPMCVRTASGSACELITKPEQDLTLKTGGCPAWVEANDKATGYYAVHYEDGLLAALTAPAVRPKLSPSEQVDILADVSSLSETGMLSAGEALAIVPEFSSETERHVLLFDLNLALEPRDHQVPDPLLPDFHRFLQKNFDARARQVGWAPRAGEPEDVNLLRPQFLRLMSTWGDDQELAGEAKSLTGQWLGNHSAVNPNLVSAVLNTAAYYGDKALFDQMLDELQKTKDTLERGRIIGALRQFRDPEAIKAGYEALLSGKVPFIEGSSLLFGGTEREATSHMAFQFLQANYAEILAKRPTGGGFDLASELPYIGAGFCDEKSKTELKDFFEPKVGKLLGARHTLDEVLEQIDVCTAEKAKQSPSVAAFLEKN